MPLWVGVKMWDLEILTLLHRAIRVSQTHLVYCHSLLLFPLMIKIMRLVLANLSQSLKREILITNCLVVVCKFLKFFTSSETPAGISMKPDMKQVLKVFSQDFLL